MGAFDKIKIAYFNGTMVEGQDGVTRTLFRIVDYLEQHNIESKFYSPLFSKSTGDRINIKKVNSFKLPFYKDYNIPIPQKRILSMDLDKFAPDIIHIHSPCPLGKFAVNYAKKRNIPVFATYHTHFPSYTKYYKLQVIEYFGWNYLKNLYNKCDAVFVPSKSIITELTEHNFENLIHLPNGIEINLFSKDFYNENWKKNNGIENKKVLLFVGRLVWEKGLQVLIDADKILRSLRNDYVFVFVGDGPSQIELQNQIPNSIFLGRLYGEKLSEVYASSDLFVFPSTTETFGIVLLEAMASKLPILCVNKNGPSDLIQNQVNGVLTPPDEPVDFANNINNLLLRPDFMKQISENAYQTVQNYSWDGIISKMFEYYESYYYAKISL